MSTAMEYLRPQHRIDVDEFFRIVESGVLGDDARVELIEGEIIDMEPIGIDHGWVVDELTAMFHSSLGNRVAVRTQGALRVDDWGTLATRDCCRGGRSGSGVPAVSQHAP